MLQTPAWERWHGGLHTLLRGIPCHQPQRLHPRHPVQPPGHRQLRSARPQAWQTLQQLAGLDTTPHNSQQQASKLEHAATGIAEQEPEHLRHACTGCVCVCCRQEPADLCQAPPAGHRCPRRVLQQLRPSSSSCPCLQGLLVLQVPAGINTLPHKMAAWGMSLLDRHGYV